MTGSNETGRIEAFSDGVFAIAITLLVLEIKVPHLDSIKSNGELWKQIQHLWPSYFAFVFSFGSILIAWINHHQAFNVIQKTSKTFMYANGFLLLTITFTPFPTAMLAEYIVTDYAKPAITFYCFSSFLSAFAWYLLGLSVIKPKCLISGKLNYDYFKKSMKFVVIGLWVALGTTILAFFLPTTALLINLSILILWIIHSLRNEQPLIATKQLSG